MHQKFLDIEAELNTIVFEREEVIRCLLVAMLARQHVFLLGPPGTGKSLSIDQLMARIAGASIFKWLMTKHTEPNEIFGPYSARQLVEHDEYYRITKGRLPEAHFAFLDEIWKSNSAVGNALLKIINERLFEQAGRLIPVPLLAVFVASNEIPTDRDECAALWDRFLMTVWVPPLQEHANRGRLLLLRDPPAPKVTVTFDEIADAQRQVEVIRHEGLSPEIAELTLKIREELERDTDKGVIASDRRWRQAMSAVAAMAFLAGRDRMQPEDLEVLVHCLWRVPGERRVVTDKVLSYAFPALQNALSLLDLAAEQFKVCMASHVSADQRFEAYEKLMSLGKDAEALKLRDRNPRIISVCEKIIDMRKRGSAEVVGA